jgi:hypothetical protein
MTNEELLEGIARAIIIARDGKRDGERRLKDPVIKAAYINDAKAVISHLAPMMQEVAGALEWYIQHDDVNEGAEGNEFYTDGLNNARKALSSLPDCWRSKP